MKTKQQAEGRKDGKWKYHADRKSRVLLLASVGSMIDQFNRLNIDILLKLGYGVDVACNFIQGNTCTDERITTLKAELASKGVRCFQIDFSRSVRKLAQELDAYRQVKRLCAQNRYVFIHCQSPVGGAIGRIVARQADTTVIYTAHGFHFYDSAPIWNWLLYYPVEKLLSAWTDVLVTINSEDYKRAKRKFHAAKTAYVQGVGVDTGKFASCLVAKEAKRRELGIPADAFVLLSVGELNRNKNHEAVIRALSHVKDRGVHYAVAGRGELFKCLQELAGRLGVRERVHLLGYRDDVTEIYQVADAYVLPSIREGLNVSLMEAMACGLACAVSKIRGNTDLIAEGRGGFLFDPKNEGDIKNKLERLIKMPEKERRCFGEHNREKIGRFDSSHVSKKMERLYKDVI